MSSAEDPKFLWLKHIWQEGLVISRAAIEDFDPILQTAEHTEGFASAKSDIHAVFTEILEWPEAFIKTGDDLPNVASCDLTDLGLTLRADLAVVDKSEEETLLLVKTLEEGVSPDERGTVKGWDGVTHQQAFDRHLRDTGVEAGLLITPTHYRLTYSPRGETPGYLEWPIEGMATTAGRPMLGGFKLILNKEALWGREHRRLHHILKESREKQNSVSTKLAGQVLGALYTLLRGFTEAADADLSEKMEAIADKEPHHFYEGLLTVLLRLVFVLFAEDRDLLPSSKSQKAKSLYDNGYSIRELFGELEQDAALYPDTMHDRYGAWGRLAGLFKLIHDGRGPDFMHERRGKLFDPKAFPFLTGQFNDDDPAKILAVSDKCIHEVLKGLLLLDGERLSYKTLDVEQIGSVYETVMGFTIERTTGRSIALRSGKANVPAYINLERVLETTGKKRKKLLKDKIDFEVTTSQNQSLTPAKTIEEIVAALENKVDERGSPAKRTCPIGTIILQPTDERRKTGSHYTPRALTHPIVKEALEPIFVRLSDKATPDEVLELKVCDPAMGSGAFLVEACRALGERLQTAWEIHKHLMPDEAKEDPEIFARREVAKRCLYGVDRNHMATDLAKLSLWLVTLSQDEDFTFLDHAFKTGDSLVGLSLDEISNVTWELKDDLKRPLFASAFAKRVQNSRDERRRIRNAPDNVTYEIQQARMRQADKELEAVRLGGDAVIAAFFAGKKAKERKEVLNKLQDQIALGSATGWDAARNMIEKLGEGKHTVKPFHWEIEFPEVFDGENPGFDSFVGNPPFAGKNTITAGNKLGYLDWLKVISPGAHGNADLAAHFFRRAYAFLRSFGTFGLIATDTISQGDTRETGLEFLLTKANAKIYRAQRRIVWPGQAQTLVSTIHIYKGNEELPSILDGRDVSRISAFIREGDFDAAPTQLSDNQDLAFIGSYPLGDGYLFDDRKYLKGVCENTETMNELISNSQGNKTRIKPFLGGNDVNSHPKHLTNRFVIDFENFPLKRTIVGKKWDDLPPNEKTQMLREGIVTEDYPYPVAEDWPKVLDVLERYVKPQRQKQKDPIYKKKWWIYAKSRPALYSRIRNKDYVLVIGSKAISHVLFAKVSARQVLSQNLLVVVDENPVNYFTLSSNVHEVWARVFSSSMGDQLSYTPTDCFQTFPFHEPAEQFNSLRYFEARKEILESKSIGLTSLYNGYHDQHDMNDSIVELRRLHAKMDDAVLRAYGWDELADICQPGGEGAPRFLHDTDEPEFAYQKRYHWPAWFRDKVLAKLLELNKERAAAEKEATKNTSGGKLKSGALQLETKGTLL